MFGGGKELLVGYHRQVECVVIVFGTGKGGCVVRHICACQIVSRKSRGYLLPPRDPLPRIGLRKSPQMPCCPVCRVGGDRARGETAYHVGTVAGQPVSVCQCHQSLRVVRPFSRGALEVIYRMGSIVHRIAGQFLCSGVPFCHERSPEWRVYEQNEVAARRVSPARASRDSLSRYLIPCHTTT